MHLHEFVQSIMFYLCMIPIMLLVCDWINILRVNSLMFIDDNTDAWKYNEYVIFNKAEKRVGSDFYICYAIVSGIMLFITEVMGAVVRSPGDDWYSEHLAEHGNTIFCGWGVFNVWIPAIYIFCVVGILVLRFALLHFRTARRLQKAQSGQLVVSDQPEAQRYIYALGGVDNIISVEACITRIRLTLRDPTNIREQELKELGVAGIIKVGQQGVQLIAGTKSDRIVREIKKFTLV